ncbi:hypothetical protein GO755_26450 [Spirosoma sp. HMF4905]|uniref:Uncharacterized protein n=1 Tax=Spirosoma arboris TaxID=2682092 RepID=A0A7K1SIF9_9BACT|nr:hypothetical protein [Spirosoma arboris]MVM33607.1 hypothetical protein [Spirosoma arboris]
MNNYQLGDKVRWVVHQGNRVVFEDVIFTIVGIQDDSVKLRGNITGTGDVTPIHFIPIEEIVPAESAKRFDFRDVHRLIDLAGTIKLFMVTSQTITPGMIDEYTELATRLKIEQPIQFK